MRCQLGRLDDDRVAGCERGCSLRQRHGQRQIPRRDERDDAERLVHGEGAFVREVRNAVADALGRE